MFTVNFPYLSKPIKILIAEDELLIAKVNALMLSKIGYTVKTVSNASKAIEEFDNFSPDIILMDIQFKKNEMTGIDAALAIRKKSQTPIIFTSGNIPKNIRQIENSEILTKPLNFEQLKQYIVNLST